MFAQQPRNETFSFMTDNILLVAESVSLIARTYLMSQSHAALFP